jgi:hypothetical protein
VNDAARYTEIVWNPLNIVSHAPEHRTRSEWQRPRMIALSLTNDSALMLAAEVPLRIYGSAILMG